MLKHEELTKDDFFKELEVLPKEAKDKVLDTVNSGDGSLLDEKIIKYSSTNATETIADFNAFNDIITSLWQKENRIFKGTLKGGVSPTYVFAGNSYVVLSDDKGDYLYVNDFIAKGGD